MSAVGVGRAGAFELAAYVVVIEAIWQGGR